MVRQPENNGDRGLMIWSRGPRSRKEGLHISLAHAQHPGRIIKAPAQFAEAPQHPPGRPWIAKTPRQSGKVLRIKGALPAFPLAKCAGGQANRPLKGSLGDPQVEPAGAPPRTDRRIRSSPISHRWE